MINNQICPVTTTLNLIGGKYKALILWHTSQKTYRFSELRKLVPEATAKMLTQQLRELERDELIKRKVYPIVPPKVEYSISNKGKTLYPILLAMYEWGSEELNAHGVCPSCTMSK
ncbi:MAG: winged helix-turn-helix transcriptional regulator [Erysipelotrichaceae bacterium]